MTDQWPYGDDEEFADPWGSWWFEEEDNTEIPVDSDEESGYTKE